MPVTSSAKMSVVAEIDKVAELKVTYVLYWDSNLFINVQHTITPVFPEGLGRGVPMYTHSSPVCLGRM